MYLTCKISWTQHSDQFFRLKNLIDIFINEYLFRYFEKIDILVTLKKNQNSCFKIFSNSDSDKLC